MCGLKIKASLFEKHDLKVNLSKTFVLEDANFLQS